jgi:hypothetical protein
MLKGVLKGSGDFEVPFRFRRRGTVERRCPNNAFRSRTGTMIERDSILSCAVGVVR